MRPPRRAARGFTLIEVLIALFILALMAGMAWQGVDMVMRSRSVAQGRMDGLLRLQSTLAQWDADLRESFDTRIVPGVAFDGATLRLTRRQPEGVQVVAWTLRGQTLQRWAAAPVRDIDRLQDTWLRSYQLLGNEPESLNLLETVSGWQVFFFFASSNAWSNAQSSADQTTGTPAVGGVPTATARDVLPDGVRVIFSFAPGGTAAGPVTRQMQLIHP